MLLNRNFAFNIKPLKSVNIGGFTLWLEEGIDKYYHRWAHGTHECEWVNVICTVGGTVWID
ncbi:hypothetical protein V3564_03130 [Bartonella sp. B12(2025)]